MIIGLGVLGGTPSVRPILPSLRSVRMVYSGHTAGALDIPSQGSAARALDHPLGGPSAYRQYQLDLYRSSPLVLPVRPQLLSG